MRRSPPIACRIPVAQRHRTWRPDSRIDAKYSRCGRCKRRANRRIQRGCCKVWLCPSCDIFAHGDRATDDLPRTELRALRLVARRAREFMDTACLPWGRGNDWRAENAEGNALLAALAKLKGRRR